MNDRLNQPTVLVLNRNWQAIHVKTPAQAFCMMASDAATALDIQGMDVMLPVTWNQWLALPVREDDSFAQTPRGKIRIPTVIVCVGYNQVPKRRPRFSNQAIWDRDGGLCQYTGKRLHRHEASIDHVRPRSKGGKTSWENCVLAHREVNASKADRLPEEAGLKLLKTPQLPRELPVTFFLRNPHQIPDWDHFLPHR
ncbi:MAG: HNH endonuclease [Verrucomicrobiae bacterium]|nr:HNH endonuclease [Verrucomicrobiae bacterium]